MSVCVFVFFVRFFCHFVVFRRSVLGVLLGRFSVPKPSPEKRLLLWTPLRERNRAEEFPRVLSRTTFAQEFLLP